MLVIVGTFKERVPTGQERAKTIKSPKRNDHRFLLCFGVRSSFNKSLFISLKMKNNKNDNNSSSNNKIEYLHIIVGFRITPAAKVVVTISSL